MSLFFAQLRAELLKMFARKRTWIGFGLFLAVEILLLTLLQTEKAQRGFRHMIERNGALFDQYFSGLTLAFNVLLLTVFLLGTLALSLVGGDIVAKEVEEGTMRMTLCRPVSRARVLLVKYLACVIYTFVLVVFIGTTALATGALWRGVGGLFAFAPEEKLFALYETGPGLARYFASLPFFALSLLSITTLAFFFSCMNMKPAAATVITISVFIVDWIFRHIPYFEEFHRWFLTTHTATWLNIFHAHIPWEQMAEDYAYLLAIDATLVLIGLASFHQRDFKG
jgi:ABC-2 type transport system permease protein